MLFDAFNVFNSFFFFRDTAKKYKQTKGRRLYWQQNTDEAAGPSGSSREEQIQDEPMDVSGIESDLENPEEKTEGSEEEGKRQNFSTSD